MQFSCASCKTQLQIADEKVRGTLDHLRFEVVQYERYAADNAESKVYLSKKLMAEMITSHRSAKTVVQLPV